MCDRVKVRLAHYFGAPLPVIGTDLLWTAPALLAQALSQTYALAISPHPLSLPTIEVSLYWHDRYHRDPASKWMRGLFAGAFRMLSHP